MSLVVVLKLDCLFTEKRAARLVAVHHFGVGMCLQDESQDHEGSAPESPDHMKEVNEAVELLVSKAEMLDDYFKISITPDGAVLLLFLRLCSLLLRDTLVVVVISRSQAVLCCQGIIETLPQLEPEIQHTPQLDGLPRFVYAERLRLRTANLTQCEVGTFVEPFGALGFWLTNTGTILRSKSTGAVSKCAFGTWLKSLLSCTGTKGSFGVLW